MIRWERPNILERYSSTINFDQIASLREKRLETLSRPHWEELRGALSALPMIAKERGLETWGVDFSQPSVKIGVAENLTDDEHANLLRVIELLIPWRKGPFSLFENDIDAEWRSDLKWDRVAPHLESLEGKRVADIGCNTGYYMFRMASERAECIIGFEPAQRCWFNFELVQRFVQRPELQLEMLGVEHVSLFPRFFDVVLCMGILYHQRNPIGLLRGIWESMKPGAQLIIESQTIPGDDSHALFPEDRYAKARNIYFIPTAQCLASWVRKAGFVDVEVFSDVLVTQEEQRKTRYAPFESLADFLDPNDSSKTIEGYPAPRRVALKARKRKDR